MFLKVMIRSREEFKRYILDTLGEPVCKVNVTDKQVEDRIDDALEFWSLYHFDGSARMFLKQIVTPSQLKVQQSNTDIISQGSIVKGVDSKATAEVCIEFNQKFKSENGIIYCKNIEGNFKRGEKLRVVSYNSEIPTIEFTLSNSDDFCVKGIIDERRIRVPDWVLGITKILPANTATSSQNLFDVQYQLRLSDIYDLTSTSLIYYEQAMQHLDLLNFELSANPYFEYNRHDGYVYPIIKWGVDFDVGQYMIFECYRALDPKTAYKMWNDIWLKKYAVALVKKQFGQNLSKYQNVMLPGGITFNGADIYQQAVQEIDQLEQQVLNNQLPPSAFFIG